MITALPAIHAKQLNKQSDGTVTVSIVDPVGIACYNPDRPAVVGDVYSVTPDGNVIARPSGTAQAWEKARIVGSSLVFAPTGPGGSAFLMPFAKDIPNG